MSYQNAKLMNLEDGQKLLETVDQHKAEIGTVAKDWKDHKTEAFAVGEYVIKDNVTYRFKAAHVANTAWNASEVESTNLGSEMTGLKSAKADKDGTHEDLTAGNALYLLSDRGDTDVAPYVFRKTGGSKNAYGREFLRKIVGGTVAWNQKVTSARGSTSVYSLTLTRSEDTHSLTISGTPNNTGNITIVTGDINGEANHVYLADIISKSVTGAVINFANTAWYIGSSAMIVKPASSATLGFALSVTNGTEVSITVTPQVFDLTQMFGSTIADAIYAMEQATPGSGVAWFRSLFPNSYYAYDAGSLHSVQVKEHRTVGFNVFDGELEYGNIDASGNPSGTNKNYIRTKNFTKIIPNTPYNIYVKNPEQFQQLYLIQYDDKKNIISRASIRGGSSYVELYSSINTFLSNTRYIKLFEYRKNDFVSLESTKICINISDIAKNDTYEPYEEPRVYPLDSTLTLRGIPKWDSTNGLYYDGDEYKPDGSVKRKYGIVDLGSLTYSNISGVFLSDTAPSGIKSGTTTYQIVCHLICPYYENSSPETTYGKTKDKTIAVQQNSGKLFIYDSAYSSYTAEQFKTAMSGVYLVYELATETTEQAEPFRELQISANGGTEEFIDAGVTASTPTRDVSVPVGTETFYPIDVVAYIEELTNPDHDMVADALILSGKYFMVGNSLYKSTSQIQAGATIIPGSNCTAKTLAEALNELNT